MKSSMNINAYVENELLYARFDILSSNNEDVDYLLKLDLEHLAKQFSDEKFGISNWRHHPKYDKDPHRIFDTNITKHILQISPKEPNGEHFFLGDKKLKSIEINWYDLCLMSSIPQSGLLEPNKLYVEYKDNTLHYVVRNPNGIDIRDTIRFGYC